MGESVVLDASWVDDRCRKQAREVAVEAGAQLVELHCQTGEALAADRIALRGGTGLSDPSDATPEIAAAMASVMGPVARGNRDRHLRPGRVGPSGR